MRSAGQSFRHPQLRKSIFHYQDQTSDGSRQSNLRIETGGRTLTQSQRRDAAVDTVWTLEHLLKNEQDVEAYLEIPDEALAVGADCAGILAVDAEVGERGIVMIDTADPLCLAAATMSMEDYTVLALTQPPLFHRLLEKMARFLQPWIEQVAQACPGFLWRICGPEYAAEPYLPPRLFEEYVVRYVRPMIDAIHRHSGYARVHCHGRIRKVLPHIVAMGADATDPIEPPPQGDIQLIEVRRVYGQQLALFGNLEACDLENMEPAAFEQRVAAALREGTTGQGRGFVLMPSACPYGRTITQRTLANYQTMVRLATGIS